MLLEYYRLVRNPSVLESPLSASGAAERLDFFRNRAGCMHCGYEIKLWPELQAWLKRPSFPPSHTFDLILAVTLRANGVTTFFTRNDRDFNRFGFFEVINPDPAA